ncbi:hypothetical protein MED121_04563 [Marinomonas sp. MED121]|nr:hypothetical protein MED121_04563 [Marinomonas sp. MED121]
MAAGSAERLSNKKAAMETVMATQAPINNRLRININTDQLLVADNKIQVKKEA